MKELLETEADPEAITEEAFEPVSFTMNLRTGDMMQSLVLQNL